MVAFAWHGADLPQHSILGREGGGGGGELFFRSTESMGVFAVWGFLPFFRSRAVSVLLTDSTTFLAKLSQAVRYPQSLFDVRSAT